MSRFVYFLRFALNGTAGGGWRRFVQVYSVFKKHILGLELVSARESRLAPTVTVKVLHRLGLLGYTIEGYKLWDEGHRKTVFSNAYVARDWARGLKEHSEISGRDS